MAAALNDLAVRNAKAKDKKYTMSDTGGLVLEISEKNVKTWYFRYTYNGKRKWLSLGQYPAVSLKAAREKRDKARVLLSENKDPAVEFKVKKPVDGEPTFGDIAREWLKLKQKTWSKTNQRTMLLRMDAYIFKTELANIPVKDVKIPDFLIILRKMEEAGHFETAHRMANVYNNICTYARLSGLIENNPLTGIVTILHPVEHKSRSAITDPAELAKLLRAIWIYPGKSVTRLALLIMPYVFVRSIELRGAEWKEIDFENRIWTIPPERMKMKREHIVPMSSQVADLFRELQALNSNSQLCFPSRMSKTRAISDVALLNALRRMDYGKDEMCIHGFRSTASTLLNEMGYRPDVIEAQLAHVETNKVRGAYNRALYLEERTKMMQEWADYLDSLRSGVQRGRVPPEL